MKAKREDFCDFCSQNLTSEKGQSFKYFPNNTDSFCEKTRNKSHKKTSPEAKKQADLSNPFFENPETQQKRHLSVNELAQHLRVSPRTIYGWVYRRLIPYQKIGPRLIRFDVEEIERWILQKRRN